MLFSSASAQEIQRTYTSLVVTPDARSAPLFPLVVWEEKKRKVHTKMLARNATDDVNAERAGVGGAEGGGGKKGRGGGRGKGDGGGDGEGGV